MKALESHISHYHEFGAFRLAPNQHRLYRHGEVVLLPPKDFDLLLLLVRNAGQLMDRESLISALWPNTVVEEANLNVHISALRKALADSSSEQHFIETVPRLGYRFIAPVTEVNELEKTPLIPPSASAPPGSPEGEKLDDRKLDDRKVGLRLPRTVTEPRGWPKRYPQAALILALGILTVALLGILAVLFFNAGRPNPVDNGGDSSVSVGPLTTYAGSESQPAFSPDGNQVAFTWGGEKNDNTDIYVRLVDGGNWVRLTTHPGDDVNPVWSPDGRNIAFYRSSKEGDGIFVVSSLGGAERKLTETWANRFGFGIHSWLHWSPDAKWLVVSDKASAEEPFALFLLSPATGEKRRLTSPQPTIIGDCSPAFSPDGKTVAFVRVNSAVVAEVNLISVDGGEPKRLTFDGAGVSNLTWTAGGREIVFSSRHAGQSRLFKIPVAGGSPQWVAASGTDAQYPTFSRQGNRLAWTQNTNDADIFRVAIKAEGEVTKLSSSLISSTAFDGSPRYSPDGKRIVFVSNRSGSVEIWLSDNDGMNPLRLTSFRGPLVGSPNWSPDGRQIVFDSRPEGNADVYAINSEGGQPRRLTTDSAEDIVPSWSRDGRWIYFTSNRSGRLQIWKVASDGGEPIQVTHNGGFDPVESPDGVWLYFSQDRGSSSIWRARVAGGEESPIFDFQQKNHSRLWAVDGKGIYFAVAESPHSKIKFYSFSDASVRTVAALDGDLSINISGLTISPDGRWLLLPLAAHQGSDLMMIENFR
jgi:Tol biopolymer transport system component/DNA-binding winged helix-turn-helix (wHTH) protein